MAFSLYVGGCSFFQLNRLLGYYYAGPYSHVHVYVHVYTHIHGTAVQSVLLPQRREGSQLAKQKLAVVT